MKFALVGDIHLGEEFEFKGVVRKLSRHSKDLLDRFILEMNDGVKPEFVVNLGDAINDVNHDADIENLRYVMNELKRLSCPVHSLAGNHEQWALERAEIEAIMSQSPLYYSVDQNEYHLVFLLSEAAGGEDSFMSDEQLAWLRSDLDSTKKANVSVHSPPDF